MNQGNSRVETRNYVSFNTVTNACATRLDSQNMSSKGVGK